MAKYIQRADEGGWKYLASQFSKNIGSIYDRMI